MDVDSDGTGALLREFPVGAKCHRSSVVDALDAVLSPRITLALVPSA